MPLPELRQALREKRRKGHRVRRSRGSRLQAALSPAPVPFDMLVRTEAGGDRSAGAAAVREHAVRPERLELVSDRDLRPSPSVAVVAATVVDVRLRSLAGYAGGQRQALRALVRAPMRLSNVRQRLAHGDETSWRVHIRGEEGENPRSLGLPDCREDGPSRSAAAAQKLFGGLGVDEPVYRDRYSAYKKLAKDLPDQFVLVYCWGAPRLHGRGRPSMKSFGDEWVVKVCMVGMPSGRGTGSPGRANKPLLSTRRNGSLRAAHSSTMCGGNSTTCDAPQRKPLQSLLRQGLNIFVDSRADGQQPSAPCAAPRSDVNCRSARSARRERNWPGCSSPCTLELAGFSPRHWLRDYLQTCAERGGRAPEEAHAWLPWGADPERVRTWRVAAPQGP